MIKKVLFRLIILIIVFWLILQIRQPSNNRVWNDDQTKLPIAEFSENTVSIKNIRNFEYRSTTDYTPRYYDKTYDLDKINSVDYIVEPFGNIGAAHTFLSFGFENKEYIAISVEIRKEKGESFSPWKGLLRNYELTYVIADERDVIGLRLLFPKNSDELAYELGLIDNSITLEEARDKYLINEQAEKHQDDPDFSIKIREGLTE
jgi:hypothetical protein